MQQQQRDPNKVVHIGVVGPYMSGKTTLCNTLHALEKGIFDKASIDEYRNFMSVSATIGCNSLAFKSVGGRSFELVDSPGLERFQCLMMPMVRNCEIIVVCQKLEDRGKVDYMTMNSDSLRWILETSNCVEKVIYVYTFSDRCPESKDPNELCTSIFDPSSFNVVLGVLKVEVGRLEFSKQSEFMPQPVVISKESRSKGCC